MLKRRKRLRAQEVVEVITRGRSARAEHIAVKYLPTEQPLRASAVVPKSLARLAVKRNLLRRAVYRAIENSPTNTNAAAVFFVKSIPKESVAPVFTKEITFLLSKMK